MPQQYRGLKIISTIRDHLKVAIKSLNPITDESLILVACCSRATFYKYVTKDSEIEREIKTARIKQRKYANSKNQPPEKDQEQIIADLRAGWEQDKEGNRSLLAFHAQVISNLLEKGVPPSVIQEAEGRAMTKPNRSVSHAGSGRGKKNRGRWS